MLLVAQSVGRMPRGVLAEFIQDRLAVGGWPTELLFGSSGGFEVEEVCGPDDLPEGQAQRRIQ